MDSLRCLFLDANHCKCLQQHGFRSVQNLNQVTPAELSLITKMPDDLCLDIKRRAESFLATDNVAPLNGTDWLSRQMSAQSYISTLCPSINSLIGLPGLPLGRIVEIYGESGSGKTQIW